jgi:hypothetical protein
MLQEFCAINDGANPLSNIEVTALLYELYGYATQKLKSWCLYVKYAEALNNSEAKLLGECCGVPCAAKMAELVNNVLECNVMLSVMFFDMDMSYTRVLHIKVAYCIPHK